MNYTRLDSHYHHPMMGSGAVSTYLLTSPHGHAALIDAGAGDADHLRLLRASLFESGSSLDDVFVSHGHVDHIAGAPALNVEYRDVRFHKQGLATPLSDGPDLSTIEWFPLVDKQIIDAAGTSLEVLHTPGHAPDHLAFLHEPSGTVLVGDLVIAGSSVIIPHSRGGDLLQYLASLERIRALKPRRLLPAHGPEIDDPESVLAGTIEHRERREREIVSVLAEAPATVPALVNSIYHGLAPGLARAAQESVRAHLEKLRREGRVVEDNGLWQER